jgi:hypothetical protein
MNPQMSILALKFAGFVTSMAPRSVSRDACGTSLMPGNPIVGQSEMIGREEKACSRVH